MPPRSRKVVSLIDFALSDTDEELWLRKGVGEWEDSDVFEEDEEE